VSTATSANTKGKRDPSLLIPDPAKLARAGLTAEGIETYYVVARRPMNYRGDVLPVGAEIPGAASWIRLETWITARLVEARTRPCHTGAGPVEGPVPPEETPEPPTQE
jgi:hypothetical protein